MGFQNKIDALRSLDELQKVIVEAVGGYKIIIQKLMEEHNHDAETIAQLKKKLHPPAGAPSGECDHGVVFDLEAAKAMNTFGVPCEKAKFDPCVRCNGTGIRKPTAHDFRQRWPRLDGKCPKGCGFEGIAYASHEHFIYGDW